VRHLQDRCNILGHEVWLAPRSLTVQRLAGGGGEGPPPGEEEEPGAVGDAEGGAALHDTSLALLEHLKERTRNVYAAGGVR
jgi:hypothetical protein